MQDVTGRAMKMLTIATELVVIATKAKQIRKLGMLPFVSVEVTPKNAPGATLIGDDRVEVDPETFEDKTAREIAVLAWGARHA